MRLQRKRSKGSNQGIALIEVLAATVICALVSAMLLRLYALHTAAGRRLQRNEELQNTATMLMEELKGIDLTEWMNQSEKGTAELCQIPFHFDRSSCDSRKFSLEGRMAGYSRALDEYWVRIEIDRAEYEPFEILRMMHPGSGGNIIISPELLVQAGESLQDVLTGSDSEEEAVKKELHIKMEEIQEGANAWLQVRVSLAACLEAEEDPEAEEELEAEEEPAEEEAPAEEEELGAEEELAEEEELGAEEELGEEESTETGKEAEAAEYRKPLQEKGDRLENRIFFWLPSTEELFLDRIIIEGSLNRSCECFILEAEGEGFRYEDEGLFEVPDWVELYTNIGRPDGQKLPLPCSGERTQICSIHIAVFADGKEGEEDDDTEVICLHSTKTEYIRNMVQSGRISDGYNVDHADVSDDDGGGGAFGTSSADRHAAFTTEGGAEFLYAGDGAG